MFEKITIIGCGLIGSSILRNINNNEISKSIAVFDKSKSVVETIKKDNLYSNISKDIQSAVKDSDLIILAVTLSSYKEVLLSTKDSFKKDAIITDTGSVKKEVNKIFENFNKTKKRIIGYGATAKSCTVLNYCKIKKGTIKYFYDTTSFKINKYLPGTKIKIKKYKKLSKKDADYVFLGAWNFKNEIFRKEKKFIKVQQILQLMRQIIQNLQLTKL